MGAKKIRIYSKNNDFQYIETLRRNRNKRHKQQKFFVEGVRALEAVLAFHWKVDSFYYTHEKPLSDWAKNLLQKTPHVKQYELPLVLMKELSQKENTSELLAIVHMPEQTLQNFEIPENLLVVLLDRPSRPGNLGTLLRSCDAFGVHCVLLTGHTADLYDEEVIRASMGSLFAVKTFCISSHQEMLSWISSIRKTLPDLQIIGSSAKGSVELQLQNFCVPTILCIGNETQGLRYAYQTLCDTLVTIPMNNSRIATSLNVACAGTTMLYEIQKQRMASENPRKI